MQKYILLWCIIITSNLTGCGWFKKENKAEPKKEFPALMERDKLYCNLSQPVYEALDKTIEPNCDAALFTSLHGLQCRYVNPANFEYQGTGKLCRRPGCTCYPPQKGKPSSDSGFSKDQATGMQLYYSVKPDKDLAKRVSKYLAENNFFACSEAETPADLAGKCLMSSKIVYRWAQIEKKASEAATSADEPGDEANLTANTEFRAHLDILGVLTENALYGGISDASLATIKEQANREPNNLLFQALNAKFVAGDEARVAELLLVKFPPDRLPTSSDWCSDYLFQRDEIRAGELNKDWLPCDNKKTHPGTDYLLASWVLQQ